MSPTATYHSIVFGPIKTRAIGISLGINAVPSARVDCPPVCVHCQTGSADSVPIISRATQLPSPGVIVTSAARRIMALSKASEKLEAIALTGNADPTRHPDLILIAENLRELRNKWYPKAALCLLIDDLYLEAANLRHALTVFDRVMARFDWGTAKTFSALTGRPGPDYKRLVDALSGLDRMVVQACFVQGKVDNSTEPEVKNWIRKLEELRPRQVQVWTVEGSGRKPGGPKPIPIPRLEEIAAEVQEKTGIKTTVLAGEALAV